MPTKKTTSKKGGSKAVSKKLKDLKARKNVAGGRGFVQPPEPDATPPEPD